MKKTIVLAFFLIIGMANSNAQVLKFGLKAGVNFANLSGSDADGFDGLTSFHFGAVGEIKVFQNFAIQPEVLYSSQGAKSDAFDDIKYDYITVPVLAKFYLITDKLSLEAGPQFAFLVNDNVDSTFETETFDFAAVGGLGFNFSKHVFAQARYVVGLTDTTKDADVKNSVIQLSIGYTF
jgi:hypothetical protein